MDLGEHYPCLDVRDLEESIAFYQKLGFELVIDRRDQNWAVIQNGRTAFALYQGHIVRNLLNFGGGDVEAIQKEAEARGLKFVAPAVLESEGSWSAEIVDPDANHIFFNTFPEEREEYARTGRLISEP
jgi:predicted lactoylglutathione lyase